MRGGRKERREGGRGRIGKGGFKRTEAFWHVGLGIAYGAMAWSWSWGLAHRLDKHRIVRVML